MRNLQWAMINEHESQTLSLCKKNTERERGTRAEAVHCVQNPYVLGGMMYAFLTTTPRQFPSKAFYSASPKAFFEIS
jgi:hypothetical protein